VRGRRAFPGKWQSFSMTSKGISSERERQSSSQRRGMSIEDFSERYGPGRTKTFEEIRAGRLRAKKIGRRTIIAEDDAEEWLRQLPTVEVKAFPPKTTAT
jgi:hypothetical protein